MLAAPAQRGGPIIWPLRAKLFHPVFLQQRPRWTGWRLVPLPPTLPWEMKERPPARPPARPPVVHALKPLPTVFWTISGQTKDSAGAVLGACTVDLFVTATDLLVETTTSNAAGYYYFKGPARSVTHYVVAYKSGSPDVAGTTVNTLIGA